MAGLKAIKLKIRSVEKTRKVTKAMEATSAAKMRKAQNMALRGRAYARAAVSILARASGSHELQTHPLTAMREVKKALYIVITSDKGLAGALNSAVLRATLGDITKRGLSQQDVSIIAVGKKTNDFFMMRGFTIEAFHANTNEFSNELIEQLVRESAVRFGAMQVDAVKIVYQNFVSTFEQRPTLHTIFPLSLSELEQVVGDILPARGVYAKPSIVEVQPTTYSVEPSEKEVFEAILPRLASIFVYHALLESQASEHSARMVAMKSASDKAGEMRDNLTLKFNKARQAAITREVSEITGGMEAMAN